MSKIITMSRKELLKRMGRNKLPEHYVLISINATTELAKEVLDRSKADIVLSLIDKEENSIKIHKEDIDTFLEAIKSLDTTLVIQCRLGAFRSRGIAAYASDKLGWKFNKRLPFNPIYDILMRA